MSGELRHDRRHPDAAQEVPSRPPLTTVSIDAAAREASCVAEDARGDAVPQLVGVRHRTAVALGSGGVADRRRRRGRVRAAPR